MKMRKSFLIVICLLAVISVLYFAANIIAKISIENKVKADMGLQLKIGNLNISPVKSVVWIKDLRLFNPEGYQDEIMIHIPEMLVDYNLSAALKGKIHLEKIVICLKELTVVKNKLNEVNLRYLEAAQEQQEQEDSSKIQIDKLKIKIGKVIFKDYSKRKAPLVTKFNIDDEESYEKVKDPHKIFEFIIASALIQSDIGYLADFNLIPFVRDMHPSCREPALMATKIINKTIEFSKNLCNVAGHTLKRNAEKIKSYFCPKKEK